MHLLNIQYEYFITARLITVVITISKIPVLYHRTDSLCLSLVSFSLPAKASSAAITPAIVPETQSYIYSCPTGQTINGYLPVMLCSPGDCASAPSCAADPKTRAACASLAPPDDVPYTVKQTIMGSFPTIHYACETGRVWYSGHKGGHITVCFDGYWTNVNDYCVEPAEMKVLRDCAEMTNYYIRTDWYRVYLQLSALEGVTVICELEDPNPDDNGWLGVYYSGDISFAWQANVGTLNRFFMNIQSLYEFTRSKDNIDVALPCVLQVQLYTAAGLFHATYDEFAVDKLANGSFTLRSVGKYHGNAGDALRDNVGAIFIGANGFGWFVNLTSNTFMDITNVVGYYGTLPNPTVPNIYIRVRPKDFDAAHACPAVLPYTYSTWQTTTEVTVPPSRAPGTSFTYRCAELSLQEGTEGGPNTRSGNVTCLANKVGGTPQWDKSVTLPCSLICPTGYFKVTGPDQACYMISTQGHPLGYLGAAKMCAQSGATLVTNPNITQLEGSMGTGFYYTGHAQRGLSTVVSPPILANCGADCAPTSLNMCIAVNNLGTYVALDCSLTDVPYICKIPDTCPANYTAYIGKCFWLGSGADVLSGLNSCHANGGGLFVPETLDDISKAEKFLTANISGQVNSTTLTVPFPVYTGINNVWGDWTVNGLYAPTADIVSLLGSDTTTFWRIVNLLGATTTFVSLYIDANAASSSPSANVLCEYPGPTGCLGYPPPRLENMDFIRPDTTDVLFSRATYRCFPGYFMDAANNISEMNVQCYGQLGGWSHFKLLPCLPSPCPAPPVPLVNMAYDYDPAMQPNVKTGFAVNYTCAANYVINQTTQISTQKLTCLGLLLEWSSAEPLPCLPTMCSAPPLPQANMTYNHNATSLYYLGDLATYRCQLGFFINGNVSRAAQTKTCGGMLYGWPLTELLPCVQANACLEDPVISNATLVWNPTSRLYQGQVEVLCDPGLQTATRLTAQVLSCSYLAANDSYFFNTSAVLPCNACAGVVNVANATTDWSTKASWLITEVVPGNCQTGFEVALGFKNFTVKCLPSGWDIFPECYKVCPDPLPEGENMNVVTPFQNREGTVHIYECLEGLYIPTTKYLPAVVSTTNVTCTAGGVWESSDDPLACVKMCNQEPAIENTTAAWDPMRLWLEQNIISLTCTESHLFAFGKNTSLTTCTATGWDPIPGCYEACLAPLPVGESIAPGNLIQNTVGTVVEYTCNAGTNLRLTKDFRNISTKTQVQCDSTLSWQVTGQPLLCEPLVYDPPKESIEGVTFQFPEGPYYLEQELPIFCDGEMLSPKGTNSSFFTLTLDGWVLEDPEFKCYALSYTPPDPMPLRTTVEFCPPYCVNQTLVVTCDPGVTSNTGSRSTTYRFTPTGWVPLEPEFRCLTGKYDLALFRFGPAHVL
ncbi:uncharacterized protein [Macrobrachium rosenbergii]|uniref:uncharacterized protein n=1 Tax=Macrobrachium rosenbergii TaxID=79674 RepID=UPI0034D784EA